MSYIKDLQEAILRLHGVESKHLSSVPVKEVFQGRIVWDGEVEVFELIRHPKRIEPMRGLTLRAIQAHKSASWLYCISLR